MKEKILNFIKFRGPVLPTNLSKEFRMDSLIMGAYLSELSSNGQVKITNVKVGSSPMYYLPGQEEKIEYLNKYLNEKDARTFALLKEKKVLRDEDLDPLTKVCLRNIKDFAVPLRINKVHIFWKYFLVSNEEAQDLIRPLFEPEVKAEKQEEIKKEVPEVKVEPPKVQKEEPKVKEKPKKSVEKKKVEPKVEKEIKKEVQEELKTEEPKEIKDSFLEKVENYCRANNIYIESFEIINKERDIELIANVPSAIGTMKYFIKARNKKKCNEGDLSSAYLKGQNRNLPTLFVSTGEIPKKTQEKLGNEFKQLVFKKI